MKKTLAIVLLGAALVGSNIWWFFRAIDGGLSYTYLQVSYDDNRTALSQVLALLPVVARCQASRAELIAAATLPGDQFEPFEKDGFVFTGRIGIRFDDSGRVVEVVRGWNPP